MTKEDYTLSIVIPCYNEKEHIQSLVEKVMEAQVPHREIIVVDDCSNDGTREMLEEVIGPMVQKIIYQKQNGGKGAALRAGFSAATGDFVVVQDADLEYDPNEYPLLIEPFFEADPPDVVYGSRFAKGAQWHGEGYSANRMANKFLTWLSNLFTGYKVTDMETCYKMFRRDVIQSIDFVENRFGFEPEITARLSKKKCKIKEVPISYYPRTVEEGKKIGYKDGLRAIYCILKYRGR